MNVFQNCSDLSDATLLSTSQGLYLKPVARLNISVQLPTVKLPGKTISNWAVMEKLRHFAEPEDFISLKVSKSTLEVVRFEGEIENYAKLPAVLARLDGRSIKLLGFHETLRIRAAESKPDFPTKHSWNSYFRDAKNMNEMKPGERPDTVHITNLPCKWFAAKSDSSKPSEYILRKVFELFGEIRCVDIPMLDPFRSQMKSYISGIKMFCNNQNMIFEAYIQFKEYICFVKLMDALRGMKLVHKSADGKAFSSSIKVDFDKTKHLSDGIIRRRRVEREKLMSKEREREEKERQAMDEERQKLAAERKRVEDEKRAKLKRQQQREERRKAKQLERLKQQEADTMNQKIATEERLLLTAQRRLESFRLLDELFSRLKNESAEKLEVEEKQLREKLVKKFKQSDVNDSRGFHRGGFRGGRGVWQFRRRRGNMPFRGNMVYRINQMAFQPIPSHAGFLPQRGFPRWSHFTPRKSGNGEHGFFPPPYSDSYYLDSAISDQYYKYFHKLTMGHKRSLSRSNSWSSSRSVSRSHSRSSSRSSSRSKSPDHSRHHHHQQSSNHRRKHSRTRSRNRRKSSCQKRRSRSKRRSSSSNRSSTSKYSQTDVDKTRGEEKLSEETINKTVPDLPSVHSWSQSPSNSSSLSWENRKDEPSSSTIFHSKPKKGKKKRRKKEQKKTKHPK